MIRRLCCGLLLLLALPSQSRGQRPVIVASKPFGESYLLETASKTDGTGLHYQGTMRSAASGSNQTLINSRNPSLYIRHLTNVYFPSSATGTINVFPAAGQKLNKSSKCVAVRTPAYTVGVQCDLYTDRF